MYRYAVFLATLLTFVVVVVGAYVRLSDAGLGCPDWPGCYGKLTPIHASEDIARAVVEQGGEHGPVSFAKAWKEMFHRYIAASLGLLLVALAVIAWRERERLQQSPALPIALVFVVVLQGTLGMWTVTLLLKPVIVTLHLIGGMTVLALLTWLSVRQLPLRWWPVVGPAQMASLYGIGMFGLLLVVVQILLGGWVSSNYAALACPDLPTCRGEWLPPMDFSNAFHIFRELGMTPQGELLSNEALTAIHWLHRVGALIVLAYTLFFARRLFTVAGLRAFAMVLVAVVGLQFLLGMLNVQYSLPLPLAAAHNAGAALLLVVYVVLNYFAHQAAALRLRPA